MRADLLDRHSRSDSPIHRLPAGVKLLAITAVVVSTALVSRPHAVWLAASAGLLLIVAALSRVPWRFLAGRLIILQPFVLGVALLALFQPQGGWVFLFLVAKTSLCLLAIILLSSTTPFSEILRVLRAIHTPWLLLTTLTLMYRYLFVLVDEAHRMRRARLSRTFGANRWRTWKNLGTVIGQLFVRSSERAERIYAAMCARGWK
jgi:cobalt/nickel transport system permease protein